MMKISTIQMVKTSRRESSKQLLQMAGNYFE
jgi:hypothetical protein